MNCFLCHRGWLLIVEVHRCNGCVICERCWVRRMAWLDTDDGHRVELIFVCPLCERIVYAYEATLQPPIKASKPVK